MKFTTAAVLGVSIALSSAALAGTPEGVWQSRDGRLKVRLSNCGGRLCGRVLWLGEPTDPGTGRPKTDKHNPDPAKRSRPLIGLKVVQGMKRSGPNQWSGLIYNADDGHTYKAHFTVKDATTARLQGCVLEVLCKAHTWRRAN